MKGEIARAPVLAKYDLRAPHRVTADSSSYALGAALLQQDRGGQWQPVAFASRRLTEAEAKYAQIEKEALAITWACAKFDFYLVGTHFEVETDHKPLVKLLGESDLANLPLRCQRFKLRLMRYTFTIFHTPGSQMILADLLSRPTFGPSVADERRCGLVEMHVAAVIAAESGDLMVEEIRRAGDQDPTYQAARTEVERGWKMHGREYGGELRKYYLQRHQLSTMGGLLMRDEKYVVPRGLRQEMLVRIHSGHQGGGRCVRRAKGSVWWPAMRADILAHVESCEVCVKNRRMQHQPMRPSELPERAWEVLGSDLFEFRGRDYLLVVDYYSRWIEVVEVFSKTAEAVGKQLRRVFGRYGLPRVFRSDNGPCYAARAFRDLMSEWNIKHVTSSPHYHEGNGMAERAVGTVKAMWEKEKDKQLALMVYRATPLESERSPAELLHGWPMRTNLPAGHSDVPEEEFVRRDRALKESQRRHANRRWNAVGGDLRDGERVWVKMSVEDEGVEGTVVGRREEPESYDVEVNGRILRRNRNHLRPLAGCRQERATATVDRGEAVEWTDSESECEESGAGMDVMEGVRVAEEPVRRSCRQRSRRHLSDDFVWN